MKEKLVTASNTKKLQILTLVPDSWSQKYCSEYWTFRVFNSICNRTEAEKGDTCATFPDKKYLVHAFYEDDEYSRQLLEKK